MIKELFSSTKRVIIKIVPHHASSVYRMELTHRHLALLAACAAIFGASLVTFEVGAVRAANEKVRTLQMATARQQQQLATFSRQTRDIIVRLHQLQRSEREIRSLSGISVPKKGRHNRAMVQRVGARHATQAVQKATVGVLSRLRDWLRGNSAGENPTFAMESTQLASLSVEMNSALIESRALEAQEAAIAEAKRQAQLARERAIAAIPSIWPTDGYVSSGFGYRSYPDAEFHPGLDIVNDYGAPVYATAAGVVTEAGWDSGGYGYTVEIDHGNGYQTMYAHSSRVLVNVGDTVRKGQQIAEIGATGFATGPHCHYEILLWGKAIDPTPYLDGIPRQVASATESTSSSSL